MDCVFRDLNAAVTRVATSATKGRITLAGVEAELERSREAWRDVGGKSVKIGASIFTEGEKGAVDPFDLAKLGYVLEVCRESKTLSDALGTIGSGYHFAEFQSVEKILEPELGRRLGLNPDHLQLMVHSGSRGLGEVILRCHSDGHGGSGLPDQSEEALEACKDIGRVIQDLVDAGLVQVVAVMRPVLTYKTSGGRNRCRC